MKYVVDTSIINKLVDGSVLSSDLPSDGEFIATHIQIDELNSTKDEERRAKLFLKFASVVENIVPTETFVLGTSRLDHGKLGEGEIYESIKKQLDSMNGGKPNNRMDALIAEVAIKNEYTLLTADHHLASVVKEHSGKV